MTPSFEILVVSSDLGSRLHLERILTKLGLDPICVRTLRECHEILAHHSVGLVFCDPQMADGDYLDLTAAYPAGKPRIVLTSRSANWDEFTEATAHGIFDVISAPCRPTDVEWMAIQARREKQRQSEQQPIPTRSQQAQRKSG